MRPVSAPGVGLAPALAFLGAASLALPVVLAPAMSGLVVAGLALALAVMARPQLAAYVLLPLTLLVTGVDRGAIVPLLRPNEVLFLLIAGALVARGIVRLTNGHRLEFGLTRLELALLALCVAGSILPLLIMAARSRTITSDDVLYALTFWKYLGLYVIVRCTIRTERQVATCLWLVIGAASLVAVIGVLQAVDLFGVPRLLGRFYAPEGDPAGLVRNRGSSTLGSSLAVGDVMVFSLAITTGWLLLGAPWRRTLVAASGLFVFGAIAAGQFSSVIGLLVVIVTVGLVTRRLHRLVLAGLPLGVGAALALQPVIRRRLSGFRSAEGLPPSWLGRLDNLRRFFWPELFSDYNYLLGVRPAARVPAPEAWREWVYIESGHTWLLWTGGIPFLAAFAAFIFMALTTTARIARGAAGPVAVAALAACAAMAVQAVLLTFDVHLVLRGAGDLTFGLLALALVSPTAESAPVPPSSDALVPVS